MRGPSRELRERHGIAHDESNGPDSADWLGVPMLRDTRVAGGIVVQSYERPGVYSEEERVLLAYEHRCCVCGFDLRIGSVSAGLEAAHIQWHNAGGPDVEANGLSLCALHHKLFDLGVFTLEPDSLRIVFSRHAIAGSRGLDGELKHHGHPLLRPDAAARPPG